SFLRGIGHRFWSATHLQHSEHPTAPPSSGGARRDRPERSSPSPRVMTLSRPKPPHAVAFQNGGSRTIARPAVESRWHQPRQASKHVSWVVTRLANQVCASKLSNSLQGVRAGGVHLETAQASWRTISRLPNNASPSPRAHREPKLPRSQGDRHRPITSTRLSSRD